MKRQNELIDFSFIQEVNNFKSYLEGEFPINKYKNTETLLLVGRSKAGKSTAYNYITGVKLFINDDEEGNVIINTNDVSAAKIGDSLNSCTMKPNIKLYNNMVVCDLPGISDSRTDREELLNSLFVKVLCEHFSNFKLLWTIPIHDLKDNLSAIKQTLEGITSMFSNSIESNIGILVTKAESKRDIKIIKSKITNIIKEEENIKESLGDELETKSTKIIQIFNSILVNERFTNFPLLPEDEEENLVNELETTSVKIINNTVSKVIPTTKVDVNLILNPSTKDSVKNHLELFSKTAQKQLDFTLEKLIELYKTNLRKFDNPLKSFEHIEALVDRFKKILPDKKGVINNIGLDLKKLTDDVETLNNFVTLCNADIESVYNTLPIVNNIKINNIQSTLFNNTEKGITKDLQKIYDKIPSFCNDAKEAKKVISNLNKLLVSDKKLINESYSNLISSLPKYIEESSEGKELLKDLPKFRDTLTLLPNKEEFNKNFIQITDEDIDKSFVNLSSAKEKDEVFKVNSKKYLYIDQDFIKKGYDLYIYSPNIVNHKEHTIDLSGVDGEPHNPDIAKEYTELPLQGNPGSNAGNLLISAINFIGADKISYNLTGGAGSDGQHAKSPEPNKENNYPIFNYFHKNAGIIRAKVGGEQEFWSFIKENDDEGFFNNNINIKSIWERTFCNELYNGEFKDITGEPNIEVTGKNLSSLGISKLADPEQIESELQNVIIKNSLPINSVLIRWANVFERDSHLHGKVDYDNGRLFFDGTGNVKKSLWGGSDLTTMSIQIKPTTSKKRGELKVKEVGVIKNPAIQGKDAYKGGEKGFSGECGLFVVTQPKGQKKYELSSIQSDVVRANGSDGIPSNSMNSKSIYLLFGKSSTNVLYQDTLLMFQGEKKEETNEVLKKVNEEEVYTSKKQKYKIEEFSDLVKQELSNASLEDSFDQSVVKVVFESEHLKKIYTTPEDMIHLIAELYTTNSEASNNFVNNLFNQILLTLKSTFKHEETNAIQKSISNFLYNKNYIYKEPLFITNIEDYINYFAVNNIYQQDQVQKVKKIQKFYDESVEAKKGYAISLINTLIETQKDIQSLLGSYSIESTSYFEKTQKEIKHRINEKYIALNEAIEKSKNAFFIDIAFGVLNTAIAVASIFLGPAGPLVASVGIAASSIARKGLAGEDVFAKDFNSLLNIPSFKTSLSDVKIKSENVEWQDWFKESSWKGGSVYKKEGRTFQINPKNIHKLQGMSTAINQLTDLIDRSTNDSEKIKALEKQREMLFQEFMLALKTDDELIKKLSLICNQREDKENNQTIFNAKSNISNIAEIISDENKYKEVLLELQETLDKNIKQINYHKKILDMPADNFQLEMNSLCKKISYGIKTATKLQKELVNNAIQDDLYRYISDINKVEQNVDNAELKNSALIAEQKLIISNIEQSLLPQMFPFYTKIPTFPFCTKTPKDFNKFITHIKESYKLSETTISNNGNLLNYSKKFPFYHWSYREDQIDLDNLLFGKKVILYSEPIYNKQCNAIKIASHNNKDYNMQFILYLDMSKCKITHDNYSFTELKHGLANKFSYKDTVYNIKAGDIKINFAETPFLIKDIKNMPELYRTHPGIHDGLPCPIPKPEKKLYKLIGAQPDNNANKAVKAGVISPYTDWELQVTTKNLKDEIPESVKKDMFLILEGECSYISANADFTFNSDFYSKFTDPDVACSGDFSDTTDAIG